MREGHLHFSEKMSGRKESTDRDGSAYTARGLSLAVLHWAVGENSQVAFLETPQTLVNNHHKLCMHLPANTQPLRLDISRPTTSVNVTPVCSASLSPGAQPVTPTARTALEQVSSRGVRLLWVRGTSTSTSALPAAPSLSPHPQAEPPQLQPPPARSTQPGPGGAAGTPGGLQGARGG